jgi:tetratricopeptide (TPR) repeat protein
LIVAAATKAFEHRSRLPELERDLTTAWYYRTVDYDPSKVIAAYRSVLERDSGNEIALNNLALMMNETRTWATAETLALRATTSGNSAPFYNAVRAQVGQGHLADAQATLDRFARAAPGNPNVRDLRGLLRAARGQYGAAEDEIRHLQEEQRTSASWKHYSSLSLAALSEIQGKLAQAERHVREAMEISEQRGIPRDYLLDATGVAWLDMRYRNRAADGLRIVEAALQRHPLTSVPPEDRPYVPLALFSAFARQPERAGHLLAEFEASVPEGIRRRVSDRYAVMGAMALLAGRTKDGIAGFRKAHDEHTGGCATCWLYELATSYEQARQPDSAVAVYERIASTPGLYDIFDYAHTLPPTYKRLGELYEQRGDRAKALGYYGRFVDLWKDADPELQPVVRDMRARLARLARER